MAGPVEPEGQKEWIDELVAVVVARRGFQMSTSGLHCMKHARRKVMSAFFPITISTEGEKGRRGKRAKTKSASTCSVAIRVMRYIFFLLFKHI